MFCIATSLLFSRFIFVTGSSNCNCARNSSNCNCVRDTFTKDSGDCILIVLWKIVSVFTKERNNSTMEFGKRSRDDEADQPRESEASPDNEKKQVGAGEPDAPDDSAVAGNAERVRSSIGRLRRRGRGRVQKRGVSVRKRR